MGELKNLFFWRSVLAEFTGMMLFIYVLCGTTLTLDPTVTSSIVRISLGIGLTIAILVQVFGPISGGHFNPAVSVAMMITRRISILRGLFYVLAQFAGGIAGAAICFAVTPSNLRGNLGAVSINKELTVTQGAVVEFLLTFILVLVIFASTDPKRPSDTSFGTPLAIGITVAICHLTGVPYTGSSINPARALATAMTMNIWPTHHWVYWVGPFIGGPLAGIFYTFVFQIQENDTAIEVRETHHLDAVATENGNVVVIKAH